MRLFTATCDLHEAFRQWRREDVVWLTWPDQELMSWCDARAGTQQWHCLIPAETFNRFTVVHVDEGRRVFPPILPETWGNILPKGLYQQWLNTKPYLIPGQPSFRMPFPRIMNGELFYVEAEIPLQVGPLRQSGALMLVLGGHEGNPPTLRVSWPPSRVKGRQLISLDTESPRVCAP